jgi:cyclic pyranopterin phosphate synthase
MLASMPSGGVYGFEAIDETLPFLPLAARRALDVLGRKLSLQGWLSLPLEERERIVRAGAAPTIDAAVVPAIDGAVPGPTPFEALVESEASSPTPELVASLGPSRPLDAARWKGMSPLDRYALQKCALKGKKLARAYDEILHRPVLTHLDGAGDARMVDIGAKQATSRRAVATSCVRTTRVVIDAITAGGIGKGDVVAVARVAGILAAKRTAELIPLCHPVQTTGAVLDFEMDASRGALWIRATVEAMDRTGVEMEAMLAASIAALTVYDMIKSGDRWATIESVRLESKSGGKSGPVVRPPRSERR